MKKVLFAFLGLIVLSGCSSYFDYYKGGVRYTQDGDDCIFYAAERGRHYSDDIRALDVDKKIVYKNKHWKNGRVFYYIVAKFILAFEGFKKV